MLLPIKTRDGKQFTVVIDDADELRVTQHKWYVSRAKGGYLSVRREKSRKHIRLSWFIMGNPPSGFVIDHINGNSLDNRRSNLRIATYSQNCVNKKTFSHTSRYRGVSWKKRNAKWVAQIKHNGRVEYIGLFHNELDAAIAYNNRASELFGDFARLNAL